MQNPIDQKNPVPLLCTGNQEIVNLNKRNVPQMLKHFNFGTKTNGTSCGAGLGEFSRLFSSEHRVVPQTAVYESNQKSNDSIDESIFFSA